MEIYSGYVPGTISAITGLHARYYSQNWGFGLYFEAKVATELSEFLLRYEPKRDGIWLLMDPNGIYGSIVIDGIHHREKGGHLRWFILDETLFGRGYGKRLLGNAIDFCKDRKYKKIYLWTFEGLDRAKALYLSFRFRLQEERIGTQWGKEVKEQLMVLEFS
jgi:GNAT superfamily N-acetyltransferase